MVLQSAFVSKDISFLVKVYSDTSSKHQLTAQANLCVETAVSKLNDWGDWAIKKIL